MTSAPAKPKNNNTARKAPRPRSSQVQFDDPSRRDTFGRTSRVQLTGGGPANDYLIRNGNALGRTSRPLLSEGQANADPSSSSYEPTEEERIDAIRKQVAEEMAERRAAGLLALSAEDWDQLEQAFTLFDTDHDGHINSDELRCIAKAMGITISKQELVDYMKHYGIRACDLAKSKKKGKATSGSGPYIFGDDYYGPARLLLSHQAFRSIMEPLMLDRDPVDDLLQAFALFDTNGQGVITPNDLVTVSKELDTPINMEMAEAMVEFVDMETKGGVTKSRFVTMCLYY